MRRLKRREREEERGEGWLDLAWLGLCVGWLCFGVCVCVLLWNAGMESDSESKKVFNGGDPLAAAAAAAHGVARAGVDEKVDEEVDADG